MRITKVELFELIRKDHYLNGQSIHQIARNRHIHRRTVRQAIRSGIPPGRKPHGRPATVMTPHVTTLINQWLEEDLRAPRKQRHTGTRVYQRLVDEMNFEGAEVTVRLYVKKQMALLGCKQAVYIPQVYLPGEEAEVDWYEAQGFIQSVQKKIYIFQMRACYSGREFHLACYAQTQQAFLEAHSQAFLYFGGVFKTIRYDNLSAAVKKVLQGRQRIETERFAAFRSHYLFEAVFCMPGKEGAHEKGGVEGGVGRFRRHHLVPVPRMTNLDELNTYLLSCCANDDRRVIMGKTVPILTHWEEESTQLLKLPKESFNVTEASSRDVNEKSLVSVKHNHYSVPANYVGLTVEVQVNTHHIFVYKQGQLISEHERCYQQNQTFVKLEHYLSIMRYKPQSLRKSLALKQTRERGEWPLVYDHYWESLIQKYGQQKGTKILLDTLWWAYEECFDDLPALIEMAMTQGCFDLEGLKHLKRYIQATPQKIMSLEKLGQLTQFERPVGSVEHYNQLLS